MKKLVAYVLSMTIFALSCSAFAEDEGVLQQTADYVYNTVKNPVVGSVGGEWAIIGLSRSGSKIPPQYYTNYFQNVESYVKSCTGVLHERKYTEYSRVALALTAIGKDPRNVAGYNLLYPLGDFEKTVWQGINGPVWALIALDSANYNIPENTDAKTLATREMYIQYILDAQKSDGGWALSKSSSAPDPDITGMTLQALAKYKERADVKEAIEKALIWISSNQNSNGGFETYGAETSESVVQIIVALCSLGISPNDARFVKNGNTVIDNLLSYRLSDGSFAHTKDSRSSNLMATEQALYALSAVKRATNGEKNLYDMSDSIKMAEQKKNEEEIIQSKSFPDIHGHKNQRAIELLAAKEIINGKSETAFDPENTMTRAEFATIIVKALGLKAENTAPFDDVTASDWFSSYVSAAYEKGIINGVGENTFNPYGTITRQEAAVMLERSAALIGMYTDIETMSARDILAMYTDYVQTAGWAIKSLAFCVNEGIINEEGLEILPLQPAKRGEIAQMIYNLLERNDRI